MNRLLQGAAIAVAAAGLAAMPAAAKTFVYCSEGSPENFDPGINTTGTSFDAGVPIYNELVQFKHGTTEVEPGLAESWTVSPDGTEVTFKLRKNVKWHSNDIFKPSRNFNADDVIFSFERQWKADNPFHKPEVAGGSYDYFGDMSMPDLLKSIDKVDDYTVKFTLTHAEAPFLADLAMNFASILSAEYAQAMLKAGTPQMLAQKPIGTGPFSFVAYQKDAQIRYKANPGYWGGTPKIDLVYAITPNAAVRLDKLRKGECHYAAYPNPADLPSIKSDPKLQLVQEPGLNIGYLAFNTQKKPFDDRRVRQAINMAIDKKAIVDNVYQGTGTPAINPIPPTMWSYNKAVKDYPYDPAKAKALLAEAGYANGFETDLWAMPVSRPYNPNAKRIAELMQADLEKVGIKAKIVSYEWGEYRKRAQAGEHQMAELGWTGDNGDPDNFLAVLLGCDSARVGGQNIAKWCNKEFNDLTVKAKSTLKQADRAKLYEQAQVIFKAEAPWFTIAHSLVSEAMSKSVVGYKQSPLGTHQFDKVELR